jgi:two-component system, NtrC family, sensor kinase
VAAGFAGHAWLQVRSTTARWSDIMRNSAARTAAVIESAMHYAMLLNRKDDIEHTLHEIATSPDVAGIRIYDKQGKIVSSSQRHEVGTHVDMRADACVMCHSRAKPLSKVTSPEHVRVYRNGRGMPIVGFIQPIENAPECSDAACHAHPADQTVLGVLDVQLSAMGMEDAQRSARSQLYITTLAVVLIVAAGVIVLVNRLVRRPVMRLMAGTERISRGDLTVQISATSGDELGDLARAFNQMTADLHRARQELTDWSRELEDRISAKTQEVATMQRQQMQVEKMASLGKLSAVVAHELNNPLGGILTYGKLVARKLGKESIATNVREELERYLSMIQSEATRCGDIVRNLLLFARRGGGKRSPVRASDVAMRTSMLVGHQFELHHIELDVRTCEDDLVTGDQAELQQALLALLLNAGEATASDQGRVVLAVDSDDDSVTFTIEDNGAGIPSDVLPHVFEPFFSTKEQGGVGVGLAVAYGIARRHGGTIDVTSEASRGTVFRMRIARDPDVPVEAAADHTPDEEVLL